MGGPRYGVVFVCPARSVVSLFRPKSTVRGVQNDTDGEMGERPDPPQKTASGMLQRPLARSLLARAFGDHSPRPAAGLLCNGGPSSPACAEELFVWVSLDPCRTHTG